MIEGQYQPQCTSEGRSSSCILKKTYHKPDPEQQEQPKPLQVDNNVSSTDSIYQSHRTRLTTIAILITAFSVAISGCGTSQVRPLEDRPSARAQNASPQVATQLLANGDTAQAARVYAQLSSTETDPLQRQEYQLLATELFFDSELYNDAAGMLSALPADMATTELQQRRKIVDAYYLIARQQPDQALQTLPQLRNLEDRILRVRALEIQARAFEQLNQPAPALKARIQLEANLVIPQSINVNHNRIWSMLNSQDNPGLQQMTQTPGGSVYRGWLEYAILARVQQSLDPAVYEQRTTIWRSRYVNHPAETVALGGLATALPNGELPNGFSPITGNQIALLLPLTGQFSEIGSAIKKGFIAARFTDGGATQVKLYDTQSNTGHAIEQYQLASAEGASLIIGPLNKSAVTNLAASNQISVPTLSLNYVGEEMPGHANLYQFGLLPEDEARDAANFANNEKYKKALILASDNIIGQRLTTAFTDTFTALGGRVLGTATIEDDSYDYSKQLTRLLGINSGHSRKRRLEKLLDTKLNFEPAIRSDIDVIFMAVSTEHARLLKPQLKFHHAGKIPVLSTAMIFSGQTDEKADTDLGGIRFNEIPWLMTDASGNSALYDTINKPNTEQSQGISRLMALGIDAYNLHREIEYMRLDAMYSVDGKTGALSLVPGNKIQRRLQWAEFQEGAPVKIREALPIAASLPPISNGEL